MKINITTEISPSLKLIKIYKFLNNLVSISNIVHVFLYF